MMERNLTWVDITSPQLALGRTFFVVSTIRFKSLCSAFRCGLNYWLLFMSNYWGHNGSSVRPFIQYCDLPNCQSRTRFAVNS